MATSTTATHKTHFKRLWIAVRSEVKMWGPEFKRIKTESQCNNIKKTKGKPTPTALGACCLPTHSCHWPAHCAPPRSHWPTTYQHTLIKNIVNAAHGIPTCLSNISMNNIDTRIYWTIFSLFIGLGKYMLLLFGLTCFLLSLQPKPNHWDI